MNIAIIPARGGSKRIPGKNIKDFHGKPIIAYSIEAAIQSECFDKIIVSTDDESIASVARAHGAETPFKRPTKISDDFTSTGEVIKHAIQWLYTQNSKINRVCCIYATAPFISPQQIKNGLHILHQHPDAYFCFPVCEYPFPIQRAISINNQNRAEMFQPECFEMRSQDLQPAFHDAGQFYWGQPQGYLEDIPMFSEHSIPMVISRKNVVDIDTMEDWEYALELYRLKIQTRQQGA